MRLRRAAGFLSLCGFGILLPTSLGCGQKHTDATPASSGPVVAVGSIEQDRQTAQQFVATLKTIPPDQRLAYMQAHPTETKVVAQSNDTDMNDTDMREQFRQLALPAEK